MPEKIKDDDVKIVAGASLWSEAWRRLRKNKLAIICMFLITIIFLACSAYAIPHLASLSDKGAFELKVTKVNPGSIAEKAGIKENDIIASYNDTDVIGFRILNILYKKIEKENATNKEKGIEEIKSVKVLIKREKASSTQSKPVTGDATKAKDDDKRPKVEYDEITMVVPLGELGIETNEPPVYFQDFSQTTQIKEATDKPPSADHWFGTDSTGRDLFARTLFGGFISFIIGMLATLVASIIGVMYGSIAGYFGGRVDSIMMRIVDVLYGLPFLMIIILIKVIADDFKKPEYSGLFANVVSVILISITLIILLWFSLTLISRLSFKDSKGKNLVPRFELSLVFLFLLGYLIYEIILTWKRVVDPEISMYSAFFPLVVLVLIIILFIIFLTKLGKKIDSQKRNSSFSVPGGLLLFFFIFLGIYGIYQISQMYVTFDTSTEWFGFVLTFIILGLYAWLTMARIARGQMLEVRSKDYVTAARALGASPARIIFRHSIPNILGPVIIYATINIPAVILLEAFLSFLGLGISEPYCSWGTLASEGFKTMSYIGMSWWLIVFPAGLMAISLFALNFLGDGIRDAIDPRMR